MDEKKMLNGMELHDEELDKVVGGVVGGTAAGCKLQADGRVLVIDKSDCSCPSVLFFKDLMSGANGLHTNARCQDCVYFTDDTYRGYYDGYCTNPDVAASLAK